MNFLEVLNDYTEVLLGVGIVALWKQASQSKAAAQKAERLAQERHLREAAQIVENTLAGWSSQPRFWERLIRRLLLGNLLKQLKQQLVKWHKQITEADKLAAEAKALLKQVTGNPLKIKALSEAIALYQRSLQIVYDRQISQILPQYQEELGRRQQFQLLVKEAQAQEQQHFFKQALTIYREAELLYATDEVKKAIANCSSQIHGEEAYETQLKQARQAYQEGKLRGAIALLESASANFPRQDGIELLEQLKSTVKGREKFRQGLNAEKLGAFQGAVLLYKEAKNLLNEPTECQIRLGIVAIKTEDWKTAISHLNGLPGEQAAYLRGFVHAKQGDLQQAHREWQSSTHGAIESQKELLKSLAKRQRLLAIQNIEQLVKAENLDRAMAASTAFVQKFGANSLVQENLDDHILPRLETAIWQNSDWGTIADKVEEAWIAQPDLKSLHNWAVAVYYYALTKPSETRDFDSLQDFIIGLSTALANIHQDPALKNIPWLDNQIVDYDSVFSDLLRRLEEAIDAIKDRDINQYLKLRDRHRLELTALRLMGQPPTRGMKVNDIFVTPGCYEHYRQLPSKWIGSTNSSQDLQRSLYTSWGLAVAACMEGDIQRAIQLKPSSESNNEVKLFAQQFIAYHEGCYQLQQQKWKQAISPLRQAKAEIKAKTEWQTEVDRLCGIQRQAIIESQEHLEFAQFWYELLDSPPAKSYLAEYKVEQIRGKLAKEEISLQQALKELQKVKQIDEENSILLDLINQIEIAQAMQEILDLLKRDLFSEAVSRAKSCKHQQVRFRLAEMCIDILINGVESCKMPPEVIYQLGKWAYELCPNEPAFRKVYLQLRGPS